MEGSPSPPLADLQGDMLSPAASPIPDRSSPSPELPLTMTASAVLSSLPRDATSALATAGRFAQEKVLVRFKPVGSAPGLSREVCKISASQKFEAIVAYLRRVLRVKNTDSVFLYVNSAFAPSLDEIVGNLHRVSRSIIDLRDIMGSYIPLTVFQKCKRSARRNLFNDASFRLKLHEKLSGIPLSMNQKREKRRKTKKRD